MKTCILSVFEVHVHALVFLFLFAHVVVSQMDQLIYMNLNRSIFSLDQQNNLVGTRLNILHYFSSTIRSEKNQDQIQGSHFFP